MELQMKQQTLDCLKQLTNQIRQEEQTQEIKLSDSMPDIGKVLGAWGQVLVRGKQWNSGSASVSGGVMAWVMYSPEDGSEQRCLETWVPFQMRWELPETRRDGNIYAACTLKSIDARSVSARKLLVRVCVSTMGQIFEPVEATVYSPIETEPDVQLLERSYPILLPKEAGEKIFELEEELHLPQTAPELEDIICYDLHPELVDQKVMAGKVVFRGTALLHLLYRSVDGSIQNWDFEVPFSQYADLDRDFEQEAQAKVIPAVTGLELENTGGSLKLRASLAGQYVVYDRPVISVVEDAYSNQREVKLHRESMDLPVVLDDSRSIVHAEVPVPSDCVKILDVSFTYDHPRMRRSGDQMLLDLSGNFQTLFLAEEQKLQCALSHWESTVNYSADQSVQINALSVRSGKIQDNHTIGIDLQVHISSVSDAGMNMVSGMELGDQRKQDPERPSVLLRRMEEGDLWSVAKGCGSTVSAIMQANGLTREPEQGRMLLIPVM